MKTLLKNQKKLLIAAAFLLLANLLFFLTIWLLNKYDRMYLDQLLYQLKSSSKGTNRGLASSAVVRVGLFGFVATAVDILAYLLLSGRLQRKLARHSQYVRYCSSKICSFFRRRALPLALALLMISSLGFAVRLDVVAYVDTISAESDFIEDHYVSPDDVELKFPAKKRNLIYIFLESMENTYAQTEAGAPITANYIPELTQLAEEHVNFSHTDGLGGAQSFSGTTWTAASMVAQTSGTIVKVPLTADDYNGEDAYMPGVVSIGEILDREGYRQLLLLGSDAEFAGRDSYFTEHGKYEILDINALKEEGRLPEDYQEWWGYEDEKLFAFAKSELKQLAETGEPFNFTMLTADTHFPDGYLCPSCPELHEEQYANVLACSSRQVSEFVSWIQAQPFYENTTIVISGDHLTMDPHFLEDVDATYVRTVYNCIIHAPVQPIREKNRQFGVFDMLPTTLGALGVQIEGDRLGLGTNLFADTLTLTERYGKRFLEVELLKHSEFYNTEVLDEE